MSDDDLRRLASQVTDYEHDIAPEITRQRERLADFKVPPPAVRPPLWQRSLYWVGWWRLSSSYQGWAYWERRSSPGYFVVRLVGQAVLITGLLALGIAVTPAGRRDLIWYARLDHPDGRNEPTHPQAGYATNDRARRTVATLPSVGEPH